MAMLMHAASSSAVRCSDWASRERPSHSNVRSASWRCGWSTNLPCGGVILATRHNHRTLAPKTHA